MRCPSQYFNAKILTMIEDGASVAGISGSDSLHGALHFGVDYHLTLLNSLKCIFLNRGVVGY